jgi:hypothetical protein
MPYGDLSTVRGCIEIYGGPIEQRLVEKGYPNDEIHPFDFRTSLENAVFKCDDVAAETLLREMTSGQALQGKRRESLLVVEAVHRDFFEECSYDPSSRIKYDEVLYLLSQSLEKLRSVQ